MILFQVIIIDACRTVPKIKTHAQTEDQIKTELDKNNISLLQENVYGKSTYELEYLPELAKQIQLADGYKTLQNMHLEAAENVKRKSGLAQSKEEANDSKSEVDDNSEDEYEASIEEEPMEDTIANIKTEGIDKQIEEAKPKMPSNAINVMNEGGVPGNVKNLKPDDGRKGSKKEIQIPHMATTAAKIILRKYCVETCVCCNFDIRNSKNSCIKCNMCSCWNHLEKVNVLASDKEVVCKPGFLWLCPDCYFNKWRKFPPVLEDSTGAAALH